MADNLPILVGNLSNEYLVQKSIPLACMQKNPYEIGELKILDTYLSRINSHNSNGRKVVFTKAEYEELMGLSEIRIEQLKKYTASLMSKIAEIKLNDKEFIQINIFCESRFTKNEFGEWTITLSCSEQAEKYMFNIEKLKYIKYWLKYTIGFRSKYSLFLYNYLLVNRYRGVWSEPLSKFRKELQCDTEYYQDFRRFREKIFDKALSEINELTDIKFKYETEKKGRSVSAIKFKYLKPLKEIPEPNEPDYSLNLNMLDDEDNGENKHASEKMSFLASACDDKLKPSEIEVLFNLITVMQLPEHPQGIWFARYHYLAQKYALMKHYNSIKKINNPFSYIKTLIEKDIANPM